MNIFLCFFIEKEMRPKKFLEKSLSLILGLKMILSRLKRKKIFIHLFFFKLKTYEK